MSDALTDQKAFHTFWGFRYYTMRDAQLDAEFGRRGTVISQRARERLLAYRFPGNVRELRNVVAVALAFGKEGPLDLAQHLAPMVQSSDSTPTRGRSCCCCRRPS